MASQNSDKEFSDINPHSIENLKREEVDFKEEADSAIYDLGKHVKIDFKELFQEPDAYHDTALGRTIGEKVIGVGFYHMFTYVQTGVYYLLSVVVGFAASLFWAIVFGANSIFIIWVAQPFTKLFFTWLRLIGIVTRALLRTFCDPCAISASLIFSSIRGKFNLRAYGISGVKGRELSEV